MGDRSRESTTASHLDLS